jgi:thiol-disulfide isomerase/thioredoxin
MQALILASLLLFSPPLHLSWEGGETASPSNDSAVRGTEALSSYVHRINVVNRGGSATCIAPGVFVTCKHLFEGLRGYQVNIDGHAVAASVTLSPSYDVAIVQLGSEAAAAPSAVGKFSLSAPYMAECLAFGFGSETVHKGVISNDDTLSLYAGEGTIEQGDSGGAVFCDGVLVGVIRGKNPNNGKVCYFTPLKDVAALVAPFTPDSLRNAGEPGADNNLLAKFPSPCIIEFTATWCGPCQSDNCKELVAWLKRSKWSVEPVDYDANRELAQSLGITELPTFVVIRSGGEAARYSGTSWREFLPVLNEATK